MKLAVAGGGWQWLAVALSKVGASWPGRVALCTWGTYGNYWGWRHSGAARQKAPPRLVEIQRQAEWQGDSVGARERERQGKGDNRVRARVLNKEP